jgi:hypothetical protein
MTHPAVGITDEETGETIIPDASEASQEEADTGIMGAPVIPDEERADEPVEDERIAEDDDDAPVHN